MVVVLEGVLATPKFKGRRRKRLLPAEEWDWEMTPIKKLIDYVTRGNVAVEVVTFISQEVCDEAAEFMNKYDIPAASVEFASFDMFARSLVWRPEVEYVVDTDPMRINRYGQKGLAAVRGSEF